MEEKFNEMLINTIIDDLFNRSNIGISEKFDLIYQIIKASIENEREKFSLISINFL